MNLETNIRPISHVKSRAAEMMRQINETHNPIVITQNGEAKGVLLDTQSYQDMVDAIGMLKLMSQGEHAIESGAVVSHEEAVKAARQATEAQ